MASLLLVISYILFLCLAGTCWGSVFFSSLHRTLVVEASPKPGDVLRAGADKIAVKWGLNQSLPATTGDQYKKVKVKLCYAPISQKGRGWRKTDNEMRKDKTCQFTIVDRPYDSSANSSDNTSPDSFQWIVEKNVPTATYFVRAYAYDSGGHEVAFGQTTNTDKNTNLFDVQGISGRHASLDVAAACFSAFSLLALIGFFFVEKRKMERPVTR